MIIHQSSGSNDINCYKKTLRLTHDSKGNGSLPSSAGGSAQATAQELGGRPDDETPSLSRGPRVREISTNEDRSLGSILIKNNIGVT